MADPITVDPSQVHSIEVDPSQVSAAPAMRQPQGSPLARMLGGFWNNTVGGIGNTLKTAASLAYQTANHPNGIIDPNSEGAKAIYNVVQSHVDQAQKAKDALAKGNYVEAFGHTLASALPLVGPAAAHAGETIGGTQPTYDRLGNVLTPGQEPDVAGGVGEGLGLIASTVAPSAAKTLKSKLPAVSVPPILESNLNPVEQGAVQFLKDRNVPVPPGTLTGSKFVKAAQAVTQSSPLGAAQAAEFNAGTEANLRRVAGDLSNEVSPRPASPESAGATARGKLGKIVEDRQQEAGTSYDQFRELEDQTPMPVDVSDFKRSLRPLYNDMQTWMQPALRNASAGFQAIKSILDGPDDLPASQAEAGLGGLKALAREGAGRNAGLAKMLVQRLQNTIDTQVASVDPHALIELQAGRAATAAGFGTQHILDALRTEPVQAFQQLTYGRDAGIGFLRQVAGEAPEVMKQIGRAYVDQLFDQATREGGFSQARTILSQWQTLGPETKKLLYPDPRVRSGLDNFFKGAEMLSQNPNPSGTALVQSAGSLNPLRWAAGYAGSKLLYTPGGVKLLTEGLKVPLAGPAAPVFENSFRQKLVNAYGPPAAATADQQ